jgi:hypothetical protein
MKRSDRGVNRKKDRYTVPVLGAYNGQKGEIMVPSMVDASDRKYVIIFRTFCL